MKDDDGCNVDNMNSQELKEGDCDDQTKDDNSECLFNNSVASDQRSDISSSKNSEISECDSGVASSQDSLFQASISSDKTKLSHSYFNSRTGTSFIHINSISRPIVRSNNNYIEKEWEVLKKKMMKPALINQLGKKPSTEPLEEQKKDISFIDEPDISNNNSLKLSRLNNPTLKNPKNLTTNSDNTTSESHYTPSKDPAYKSSYMSKSQSEDTISESLRSDPICSLTSSFYEPLSSKDDYIGSSFSNTFLSFSNTANTLHNPEPTHNSTTTTQTTTSKSSLPSSVFLKPLSSIKTSLSHSSTEIISCTYSPVSSASLFNSSNNNPFKVQSYKDEFLSLDPNYTSRNLLTTAASTKHHNMSSSLSSPLTSSSSSSQPISSSSSSSLPLPLDCFSPQNPEVKMIPEEIELETFSSSSSAYNIYNNNNNADINSNSSNNNNYTGNNNNNKDKSSSLTLRELSCYNNNTTTTAANTATLSPIISHTVSMVDSDLSSKSAKYQEMVQRRRMRSKKEQTTTSDKVPDYVGAKPLEEIIDFICSNENKATGSFEKNHKKSKKKVGTLSKEVVRGNLAFEGHVSNDKAKEAKLKPYESGKVSGEKFMNGEVEVEEEVVIDFTTNDSQQPPQETANNIIEASVQSPSDQGSSDAKLQQLDSASQAVSTEMKESSADVDSKQHGAQRTESSINSLDHIDKFTNVSSFYKNPKETTPDHDHHKPQPTTTTTNAILFNDCDIELDAKLIFTEDVPKTGSFSVVTKRKKVKSKHHSSDSQDSNNTKVLNPLHSIHPTNDKALPCNRSKFNPSQTKATRESNSAKVSSKPKHPEVSAKACLPPLNANEARVVQTLNAKTSQAASKTSSFARPISSPQLHSTTFNQSPSSTKHFSTSPLTTITTTAAIITTTSTTTNTTTANASVAEAANNINISNLPSTTTYNILNQPSTTTTTTTTAAVNISEPNKPPTTSNNNTQSTSLQTCDSIKTTPNLCKGTTTTTLTTTTTTSSKATATPFSNNNSFFLDTKHLVKSSHHNNDFLFGYDGDLLQVTNTTTITTKPTQMSTQSNHSPKSKVAAEKDVHGAVEEVPCGGPGGDGRGLIEGLADADHPRDIQPSFTFVHTSIVNTTDTATDASNINPNTIPSTTINSHSTQLNNDPNIAENMHHSGFKDRLSSECCSGELKESNHTHQHSLSPPHNISKQLQQHPPHLHTSPLSPPLQRPFQHYPQQQHPPILPLPQWYLPFSMPMMVFPNNNHHHNNPNNNHLHHNNPNNSHNHNSFSPPNNLQINSPTNNHYNAPPQSIHPHNSNNYSSINVQTHFSTNDSHHPNNFYQSQPLHPIHRLPRPPHPSKHSRISRHFHSHPSSRHDHFPNTDTHHTTQTSTVRGNTQVSTLYHYKIEPLANVTSPTEKHKDTPMANAHASNAMSPSSSSSTITSPPLKSPSSTPPPLPISSPSSTSPQLPLSPSTTSPQSTQLKSQLSSSKSHFNLTKAQIYLDSIFKEVLNSKDVKVYPSTG